MDAHLPRAALRNPIRFELSSIRTHLLKRLVRTYERGLSGEIDKESAPGYSVGVKAAIALLDRTDPAPKAIVEASVQGNLVIAWQTSESPSPTPLEPSRPSSIASSPSNGHARPSSSVTDDLESL